MTDRRRLRGQVLAGCAAILVLAGSGAPDGQTAPPPAVTAPPSLVTALQSERNANYDIDVTLDPGTRMLTGSETITWRNTGAVAAYSLRLHLYWNAFRNSESSWMKQRKLAGDNPVAEWAADDFGYTDVTGIQIVGPDGTPSVDLKPTFRAISPSDQNQDDRSLALAQLATPVQPGETLRLRVTWKGKFPKNFDRTGAIGNYFFVSQWFPKLGVFEPGGWLAHQFFANSEFYSDFGRYDVRMTVPSGWVVGATGREQSRSDAGVGHDHASLRARRCARFRVDDEPGLHRADAAVRACRACRRWRCGCCCSPSTRARPIATSPAPPPRSATTASGSAVTPTATSRSSIRRFKASRAAWSIRRSLRAARGGWRRAAATNLNTS